MPPINLTEGAITMLSSGDARSTDIQPVLQVADIRLINPSDQSSSDRYRILLSDGEFTQQAILLTQHNDLARSQKLQKGSIIQLNDFVCIQRRMIIAAIALDVIVDKCDPIGEPKQFLAKTDENVSSVDSSSTPGQAMNQPAVGSGNPPTYGAGSAMSGTESVKDISDQNPRFQRMPRINLTEGAIAMLSSGDAQDTNIKPVLQVADIRLISTSNQSNIDRYRVLLSDGSFTLQGMLTTEHNHLVWSEKLQKGSIIQLTQYVCNLIQDRMIVVIIDLDVKVGKCDAIGEPKLFPAKIDGNVSSVPLSSTQAQPHRRSDPTRRIEDIANRNPRFHRMPPINLTEGAIAMMSSGYARSTDIQPVLQVADIRLINPSDQIINDRYRILLSDGAFLQQGMLLTQRNYLVRSEKLQKGSIIQLNQYVCNLIQSRTIIIIIDLDVMVKKCDLIGEPKKFPAKTDENVSSVSMSSTPAEPHRRSDIFSKKRKEASSRFVEEVTRKNAIKQQKLQLKMEVEKMRVQAQKEIEQMRIEAMREQEHKQFEKDMMMMDPNSASTDEGKIWIIEQQKEILHRSRKNNYVS